MSAEKSRMSLRMGGSGAMGNGGRMGSGGGGNSGNSSAHERGQEHEEDGWSMAGEQQSISALKMQINYNRGILRLAEKAHYNGIHYSECDLEDQARETLSRLEPQLASRLAAESRARADARQAEAPAPERPGRLTRTEFATRVGSSRRSVARWEDDGVLPHASDGKASYSAGYVTGVQAILADLGLSDRARLSADELDQLRAASARLWSDLLNQGSG